MGIRTIKQFVRFCYDDIAEELGFTRIGNGYYKVLEYCIIGFGISRSGYTNFLNINFDIIPLSGDLCIGETLCNMPDIGFLCFLNDKEKNTGSLFNDQLEFSSSFSQEHFQLMKDKITDIFERYQKPCIDRIHDLTSAYAVRQGWNAFVYALSDCNVHEFSLETNYVRFLLELKYFKTLMNNYEAYRRWFIDLYGPAVRWNPEGTFGKHYSLLLNHRYDEIDDMLDKCKKKNIETLIALSDVKGTMSRGRFS